MQQCSYLQLILFIIAALSISNRASANIEISVKPDAFKFISPSDSRPPFDEAFTCGKRFSFYMQTGVCDLKCTLNMCEENCSQTSTPFLEADFQVEECTDESVALYSTKGHSLFVNREDYAMGSNTIAVPILKGLNFFYNNIEKVEIDSAYSGQMKNFIEDGEMKTVFLTSLTVHLYPRKSRPDYATRVLHLDLERKGLDQVMCFSDASACVKKDYYLIKRKGLVNGSL